MLVYSIRRLALTLLILLVTMTLLGDDMETVFSVVPCPAGPPVPFRFDHGFSSGARTTFLVDPGPPPYQIYWNYTAENSTDSLHVEGTLGMVANQCADAPTRFSHSNVVAVLMPTATIRVSAVEVCWNTVSNRAYQVQYQSALTTNTWTNLGSTRTGDGLTNCVTDNVPLGGPQCFYRVLTKP